MITATKHALASGSSPEVLAQLQTSLDASLKDASSSTKDLHSSIGKLNKVVCTVTVHCAEPCHNTLPCGPCVAAAGREAGR
jgi:hypothetical protein